MTISAIRASAQPARSAVQARAIARPVWVLGTMIVASTIVRTAIALRHSTSRYFPDEYIYTALSRSIAHGSLMIRGQTAHFPALLEPLVAAPLWGLFSTETAYRLVQTENALAASLAAIPIYMIARDLKLSRGYAYLCCLYALVDPDARDDPVHDLRFRRVPVGPRGDRGRRQGDRPAVAQETTRVSRLREPGDAGAGRVLRAGARVSHRCVRDRAAHLLPAAAHGDPRAASGGCRRGRRGDRVLLECPVGCVSPGGLDLDSPPGVPVVARGGRVHGPGRGCWTDPPRSRPPLGVRSHDHSHGDSAARPGQRVRCKCGLLQGALPLRAPASDTARVRDLSGTWEAAPSCGIRPWQRRSPSRRPDFRSRATPGGSGSSIPSR